MNEKVFELEQRFQPFLLGNDYTFVGPEDQNLLIQPFASNANLIAPVVALSRTIHHALSNKEATLKACQLLPAGTELRVYVVVSNGHTTLMHASIDEYCRRNKIDFEI
ncbi:hypothetical protein [Flavobacterium humidisoli]|uniref:Uncharacterized protein n=1 Tax=Flavobacterium humidisoli TaxID=2937442 RepID=A0ABY4LLH7_9FLAO|nr:hypothetical protein [Flavobacterium humidisoli]UPZ13944.1 hypothetical protein M0M44_14410 [Flavobacterium humidisoli]